MTFNNNQARKGGAIFFGSSTRVVIKGNALIKFTNNSVTDNGGAIYYFESTFAIIQEVPVIILYNNSAKQGGGIFIEQSDVKFIQSSLIVFINNTALQAGGAIYVSDHSKLTLLTNVSFSYNTASDYGGAVYMQLTESSIAINTSISNITFKDNSGRNTRKPVYISMPKSCNSNCLLHDVAKRFQYESIQSLLSNSNLS